VLYNHWRQGGRDLVYKNGGCAQAIGINICVVYISPWCQYPISIIVWIVPTLGWQDVLEHVIYQTDSKIFLISGLLWFHLLPLRSFLNDTFGVFETHRHGWRQKYAFSEYDGCVLIRPLLLLHSLRSGWRILRRNVCQVKVRGVCKVL